MSDSTQLATQAVAAIALIQRGTQAQRASADAWLKELVAAPIAWEVATLLLAGSDENEIRHYGAQVWHRKVLVDWASLSPGDRVGLRSAVWAAIRSNSDRPNFIVNKLAVVAVAISFQMILEAPESPVVEGQRELPGSGHCAVLLTFLTALPQEVSTCVSISPSQRKKAHDVLLSSAEGVLQYIGWCLRDVAASFAPSHATELRIRAIDCYQAWADFGVSPEVLIDNQSTALVVGCLQLSGIVFEKAVEAMCVVIQSSVALRNIPQVYVIISWVMGLQARFKHCSQTGEYEICLGIAKLVAAVVDAHNTLFNKSTALEYTAPIINFALMCTAHPNKKVSQHNVNTWVVLESVVSETEAAQLWMATYRELVGVLLGHLRRDAPATDEFDDEDARQYKREAQDALMAAFYILRADYLRIVMEYLLVALHDPSSPAADACAEVVFVALESAAQWVNEDNPAECNYMNSLFEVLAAIASRCSQSTMEALLSFVSECGSFLRAHPKYVAPLVDMLIFLLNDPKIAYPVASAVRLVFANCARHVASLGVLEALVRALAVADRSTSPARTALYLVESSAKCIAAMNERDPQAALRGFSMVMSTIESGIGGALTSPVRDAQALALIKRALSLLSTLFLFAGANPGESSSAPHPGGQFLASIPDLLLRVCTTYGVDVAEAIGEFVRDIMQSFKRDIGDAAGPLLSVCCAGYEGSHDAAFLEGMIRAVSVLGDTTRDGGRYASVILPCCTRVLTAFSATWAASPESLAAAAVNKPFEVSEFFTLAEVSLRVCPACWLSADRALVSLRWAIACLQTAVEPGAVVAVCHYAVSCIQLGDQWGEEYHAVLSAMMLDLLNNAVAAALLRVPIGLITNVAKIIYVSISKYRQPAAAAINGIALSSTLLPLAEKQRTDLSRRLLAEYSHDRITAVLIDFAKLCRMTRNA